MSNESIVSSGNFWKTLNILLILVFLGIVLAVAMSQTSQFMRMRAVEECGKIGRFEKTMPDDNSRVSYPIVDVYKSCLNDKGY